MVDWCLLNKFSAQLIILYLKVLYFPSLFPAALSEGKNFSLSNILYWTCGKIIIFFRENANKENMRNKDNFLLTFNYCSILHEVALKYDSETRNQCTSSNSGGIEILGYGVNNSVEKCKRIV